jgi:hypothetical protein
MAATQRTFRDSTQSGGICAGYPLSEEKLFTLLAKNYCCDAAMYL